MYSGVKGLCRLCWDQGGLWWGLQEGSTVDVHDRKQSMDGTKAKTRWRCTTAMHYTFRSRLKTWLFELTLAWHWPHSPAALHFVFDFINSVKCPCNVTHDSVTLIFTFLIIIIIIIYHRRLILVAVLGHQRTPSCYLCQRPRNETCWTCSKVEQSFHATMTISIWRNWFGSDLTSRISERNQDEKQSQKVQREWVSSFLTAHSSV